jgi:hypothetical protein
MQDLREFTRELMVGAERDLGTKLDWVAIDHWNTDNPHVHVLIRGRADGGQDLVISRHYLSRGFGRGPKTASRWNWGTAANGRSSPRWKGRSRPSAGPISIGRCATLQMGGAGIANLRPGGPDRDPELRRLMVGRAAKLERLGLAEQVAPGCWTFKPGIQGYAARSRGSGRHHQDHASGNDECGPRAQCFQLCFAWRRCGRSGARPPGRTRAGHQRRRSIGPVSITLTRVAYVVCR